jgi:hypothetical protein
VTVGKLASKIYAALVSHLAQHPSVRVRGDLWKVAREKAVEQLGDRQGNRWWRERFADVVERRDARAQPHHRSRPWSWKRGPGRQPISPKNRRGLARAAAARP